jgi:hypothetical protein
MNIVYLTRRNLLTLLSKLDRGDESSQTIIKYDTEHPQYPCSTKTIVCAVEDEDYYTDRPPGDVHHKDQPY